MAVSFFCLVAIGLFIVHVRKCLPVDTYISIFFVFFISLKLIFYKIFTFVIALLLNTKHGTAALKKLLLSLKFFTLWPPPVSRYLVLNISHAGN